MCAHRYEKGEVRDAEIYRGGVSNEGNSIIGLDADGFWVFIYTGCLIYNYLIYIIA